MAAKPILTIISDACRRIGLVAPNTAVGSTDLQVQQLVALANEEGKELADRYPWTALIREATFVSTATEDQGAMVPTIVSASLGFKYIFNDTIWNRSSRYPLAGPTAGPRWQAEKAFGITGPYSRYRIRGGHLLLNPAPSAGLTMAFEFMSENWVLDTTGVTSKDEFTADDDYPALDSNIVTQGVVWRFKQAKGLEFSQDFEKYENMVSDAMARDGTKPIANMNGPTSTNFQPWVTIPLTDWNQ